jgi:hypothetical protein
MAPNSAGAQRVFSLLKILFGSNQNTAQPDYIRGFMVLRYSNTKRPNEASKIKLSFTGNVVKRQEKNDEAHFFVYTVHFGPKILRNGS